MSIERSRTAEPIVANPRGGAMGTWGVWLSVLAVALFIAGMAAAALYLETGRPGADVAPDAASGWPPEDVSMPGIWPAATGLVLAVVGAASAGLALRRLRGGHAPAALGRVAGAVGALTATVVVLVADLRGIGFRWDEHAYTSVYWVHTATAIVLVGVAALLLLGVLVQQLVGIINERRHLELTVATINAGASAAMIAVLLAVVHLLPRVTS